MHKDGITEVSVVNPAVFNCSKYSLTSLPRVESKNAVFLLTGKNRSCAEEDIMKLVDILRLSHEYDERIPLCRIYTDDNRFDYSSALTPDLYTHLTYGKLSGEHYYLILHYYISIDDGDCIFGDITYGNDGEISRFTAVFEHKKDVIFIDCSGDGSSLVVERADFLAGKRKKHRYPFIMVNSRAMQIFTATVIMVAAIATAVIYLITYSDNITRNAMIITPSVTQSESSAFEFLPSGTKEASPSDTFDIAESTEAVTNDLSEQPIYDGLTLVDLSTSVSAGSRAYVTVKGESDTVYSISVYYSSGKSSASGLESKMSDSDGLVSWSWSVGSRTSAGKYRIVISAKGESYTYYFEVTQQ